MGRMVGVDGLAALREDLDAKEPVAVIHVFVFPSI